MTIFIHGRLFQINCSPLQARLQCFVKISNPLDIALSGFLIFQDFIRFWENACTEQPKDF